MNRKLTKYLTWLEISVGVIGLLFVVWLAISTKGFSSELDMHGLARYVAIVVSVFSIITIAAGLIVKIGRYGPFISSLLFFSATGFVLISVYN